MKKKREPLLYLYKKHTSLDSLDVSTTTSTQTFVDDQKVVSKNMSCDYNCQSKRSHRFMPNFTSRKKTFKNYQVQPLTTGHSCLEHSPNVYSSTNGHSIVHIFPPNLETISTQTVDGSIDSKEKSVQTSNEEGLTNLAVAKVVAFAEDTTEVVDPSLVTSWEEMIARRLFMGRRCWSLRLRSHRHPETGCEAREVIVKSESPNSETLTSDSDALFKQVHWIQKQNKTIQDMLEDMSDRLDKMMAQKEADEEQESVSYLMSNILQTQKERERVMDERLQSVTRDRDRLMRQLNDLTEKLSSLNVCDFESIISDCDSSLCHFTKIH